MGPLTIPTADGGSRAAVTPAEQQYAVALRKHSNVRKDLGAVVTVEVDARRQLEASIRTRGPTHPATNAALQLWRQAMADKAREEQRLRQANAQLEAAVVALASETAATWSAA